MSKREQGNLFVNAGHTGAIGTPYRKLDKLDQDRWLSAIRAPHERVFAHRNKKVRYRGLVKVQFQVGVRALAINLKRLMTLGVAPNYVVPYIG